MIELLAPAGNFKGMEGAIGAGADAVYAGGSAFGARAYAGNFDREEMLEAIDYVHIRGKKLYLTVNTLLKDREIEGELYGYLAPFYERGLDAVLVQDMGVLEFIRRQFPELPVHASTQMTVTGPLGMGFLAEKGVTRVVAARELSLDEIRQMHRANPMEIEVFVHGALCYCYSGQCLFSSLLGGRSGNRGRCAQPCRLPYQYSRDGRHFSGQEDSHPLSPKDMCALELLPELIRAGVSSLKIEGRMKQPGYTAGVVRIYRKYLDRYALDSEHFAVDPRDRRELLELFSRGGSHEGYFRQHNGPDMIAFRSDSKIRGAAPEITRGKVPAQAEVFLSPDQPAVMEVSAGTAHVRTEAGIVQRAQKQPLTEERIRRQMEKTGDTPFALEELKIHIEEPVFLPVKTVNELRREALESLSEALCAPFRRKCPEPLPGARIPARGAGGGGDVAVSVSCETAGQAEACRQFPEIRRLYLPLSLVERYLDSGAAEGPEIWLSLPHVTRAGDLEPYRERITRLLENGLSGFLARNLESYVWVRRLGAADRCRLDAPLYTWNAWSRAFWEQEGIAGDTVPLELNGREIAARDNRGSEMLVYGLLPLMVSAQCLQKNADQCRKNGAAVWLKDRYQKKFPVKCYCEFCYNVIYNSIPFGLLKEAEEVKKLGTDGIRLSFTLESGQECGALLKEFLEVYRGGRPAPGEVPFTKGHWKRGVE